MSDLLNQKVSPEDFEEGRKTLIDFRRRIANNEAIPPEELAGALLKIRQLYGKEATKKAAKPKKAPAKKVDADDLLKGIIGGL